MQFQQRIRRYGRHHGTNVIDDLLHAGSQHDHSFNRFQRHRRPIVAVVVVTTATVDPKDIDVINVDAIRFINGHNDIVAFSAATAAAAIPSPPPIATIIVVLIAMRHRRRLITIMIIITAVIIVRITTITGGRNFTRIEQQRIPVTHALAYS